MNSGITRAKRMAHADLRGLRRVLRRMKTDSVPSCTKSSTRCSKCGAVLKPDRESS